MKSILLHIYEDTGLEARIQATFDVVRAMASHITCLHATPFEDYLASDPLVVSVLPEEFSGKMERRRLELQGRVEARLRSEGVSWDWVHVDEPMASAVINHSMLVDLVVMSLAGPALMKDDPRPIAAADAMRAQAPVLALPEGVAGIEPGAPALIAWNGSPEAAMALRSALPLLRLASEVVLLEVEEDKAPYSADRPARYLARHGIEAEIILAAPGPAGTSATIAAAASDHGAGLIIMGAYGRSRIRELLLGGVTRDLISGTKVPLLLSH